MYRWYTNATHSPIFPLHILSDTQVHFPWTHLFQVRTGAHPIWYKVPHPSPYHLSVQVLILPGTKYHTHPSISSQDRYSSYLVQSTTHILLFPVRTGAHPIWYKVPHPSSYSQSGQVLILSGTKYHTHPPISSQDRCSSYLVQSTTPILLFPVRTGAHPIWYKVPHPSSYSQSGQVLILPGTKYHTHPPISSQDWCSSYLVQSTTPILLFPVRTGTHPIWYKVPHTSSYFQSGQVLILSGTKYHTHPPISSQDRCSSYLVQSTTPILLFPVRTGTHPIWYKVPHPSSYYLSGQVLILSGTKYHTHPPITCQDRCSSYLVQSTTPILLFPVRTGAHPIWYKVPHPSSYYLSGQMLILSGTKYHTHPPIPSQDRCSSYLVQSTTPILLFPVRTGAHPIWYKVPHPSSYYLSGQMLILSGTKYHTHPPIPSQDRCSSYLVQSTTPILLFPVRTDAHPIWYKVPHPSSYSQSGQVLILSGTKYHTHPPIPSQDRCSSYLVQSTTPILFPVRTGAHSIWYKVPHTSPYSQSRQILILPGTSTTFPLFPVKIATHTIWYKYHTPSPNSQSRPS